MIGRVFSFSFKIFRIFHHALLSPPPLLKNYYEKLLKTFISSFTGRERVKKIRLEMEKVLLCYKCVFSCEKEKGGSERMCCEKLHERSKSSSSCTAAGKRRDDKNYNMNLLTNMLSLQFNSRQQHQQTTLLQRLEKFRFFSPFRSNMRRISMFCEKFFSSSRGTLDFLKEKNLSAWIIHSRLPASASVSNREFTRENSKPMHEVSLKPFRHHINIC